MLGAAKNRTASPRETGPAWSVAPICRDHASSAVKVIARRRAPTPSMSAMASGRPAGGVYAGGRTVVLAWGLGGVWGGVWWGGVAAVVSDFRNVVLIQENK